MEWNRQTRYTPYQQWPQSRLTALKAQAKGSKWRMQHHIQPASGLLNDPNGFSYFNQQWHLFYQVFPYGPVHGLKAWQHVTSKNLIDWHDEGLAIQPDTRYDSHGAYTGTALPIGDRLFIMYTGNVRDEAWQRQAYQLGAWMGPDNHIEKLAAPLIDAAPTGYTTSFRDPYLLHHDGHYQAIIGGQTTAEVGAALVYDSPDLQHWQFKGELNLPAALRGYMVECPNLVFIGGQPVFLFCPQGLPQTTLAYQNIYPNVYIVGQTYDWSQATLTAPTGPTQLDAGFDVYATQAFNAPDGRALAVSWIGLPEVAYPTDAENWAHCLSVVKTLTLKDNHLYQNPVAEVTQLRTQSHDLVTEVTQLNGAFEVELTVPAATVATVTIKTGIGTGHLTVTLDARRGQVTVDRSATGHPFAEKYGQVRTAQVTAGTAIKMRLIVDVSVFECYINEGYTVLTGRFFLDAAPTTVQLAGSPTTGTVWEWRK
ncbi:sucrose-6-phosphate hydrolase [Lactobacillus sp. CBA3606]|uniref:sucrose-6-phosphate hydrolase n=1 Tax=Lactobacillus sp. CBA3606 TaxID=2099789 RepID=UPI000CFB3263|nr:sucrose-6-phosphate hydrolase [Lactobacillus sp. CBA3606]AVK64215.1 sucrose-6-phosphate hydrolase [Lactobacillus sp. CBA3606]